MKYFFACALVLLTVSAFAKQPPTLYIQPGTEGFETYVSAAVLKKKLPVTILPSADGADYVLTAGPFDIQNPSIGSKIEDSGTASVQLLKGEAVVWSYSVTKGRGQKNRRVMAEAIARELKDEVFKE